MSNVKIEMELVAEGEMRVKQIGKFTERAPHQVVLDALIVYDEVLEAWFGGKQVVILDEKEGTFTTLENKDPIKNRDLAKEYFESP